MAESQPVKPLQNVPCLICSTSVRIRYLDDHSPEELASCTRRFRAQRAERASTR